MYIVLIIYLYHYTNIAYALFSIIVKFFINMIKMNIKEVLIFSSFISVMHAPRCVDSCPLLSMSLCVSLHLTMDRTYDLLTNRYDKSDRKSFLSLCYSIRQR